MDEELKRRLDTLEAKVDAAFQAAEKARKYLLVIVAVTVVAFVLPLIGLVFAIPSFISTYGQLMQI
jgi:hypothetical protein